MGSTWTWVALGAGLVVRWALSLGPHSGQGVPPMFGDFEAQRHWVEVTRSLPLRDWYRNSTENDLLYWGLDYPPLTAYHSWLIGAVVEPMNPAMVALGSSRGREDDATRLAMRLSVLVSDLLILFPAAAWLGALLFRSVAHTESITVEDVSGEPLARSGAQHEASSSSSSSSWIAMAVATTVLAPALLLIDHGHFQYNGVSLGLVLASVAAAGTGRWVVSATCFTLALQFKQMTLYLAPAIGVFFLVRAATVGLSTVPWAWMSGSTQGRGVRSFVLSTLALACVVVGVSAALWLPFCLVADVREGETCRAGLAHVLERVFPVGRGLFEDKVSNVWCALEPVLRLRRRTVDGSLATSTVVFISFAATLAGLLPLVWNWIQAARGFLALPASESSARRVERLVGARTLLLAMVASGLTFFLLSFQVHEKSILLPLLPAAALVADVWLPTTADRPFADRPWFLPWLVLLGTTSMLPLLVRDALLSPTVVVAGVWAAVTIPWGTLLRTVVGCSRGPAHPLPATLRWLDATVVVGSVLGVLSVCGAWAVWTPPPHLRDLFPQLLATLHAAAFCWAWLHTGLEFRWWTHATEFAWTWFRGPAPPSRTKSE